MTTYLVDKLALRAGGEKDEDLADTVGVCTLRVRTMARRCWNCSHCYASFRRSATCSESRLTR